MEFRPHGDPAPVSGGEPFLESAAAFLAGVSAGLVFTPGPLPAIAAAAAAVLLALVSAPGRRMAMAALFAVVGVAIAAAATAPSPVDRSLSALADREVVLEGDVVGLPRRGGGAVEVELALRRLARDEDVRAVRARIRATIVTAEADAIRPGDRLRIRGTLRETTGKRFPGGRNGRWSALAEGYRFSVWTEAGPRCVVVRGNGAGFHAAVDRHLAASRALLARLPVAERNLLEALLLGQRRMLDESVEELFRRSGLAHLLSISGIHVSMLGWLIYLSLGSSAVAVVSGMDVPRLQRAAALLAVPPIVLYTVLSGAESPAVRSCIMAGCYFTGVAMSRRFDGQGGLALAAVVIVVAAPTVLAGPSFQLSFLAVTMIMAAGRQVLRLQGGKQPVARAGGWLRDYALMTASAVLGTLPLAAFHFGEVSLNGFAAGLVAIPLTGLVILPAGLGAVLLAPCWEGMARLLFVPAAVGCRWLAGLAAFFSPWQWGIIQWRPSPLGVICIYGLTVAGAVAGGSRLRWRSVATVLLVGIAAIAVADRWVGRGGAPELRVTFLDVGQGDAAVVEMAAGAAVLVDCGGKSDFSDKGRSVVLPFLRSRGIRRLDGVVVSHAHPDHLGGLAAVVRGIACKAVYAPFPCLEARRAVPVGVSVRGIAGPASLPGAGCRVAFLPSAAGRDRGVPEMSNEVMQMCRFDGCWSGVLFSGDAGRDFLDTLTAASLARPVMALKVPHHGSRHSLSPSFVAATRPGTAVISTGRNPYGHPHPQVVEHLARNGAEVVVTRDAGSVELEFRADGTRTASWDGRTDMLSPRGRWHWLVRGY